jgi:hypothetical protein
MQITINLDELFCDENGQPEESTEQAIRRQVVARLTESYRQRVFSQFDAELARVIQDQLKEAVITKMPSLVEDLMNSEFTPVDTYGRRGQPTTFRNELIKGINSELEYKPKSFSSEENTFTKAVKAVVAEQLAAFKKEFTSKIDTNFRRDALAYAVDQLQQRLGLPKNIA